MDRLLFLTVIRQLRAMIRDTWGGWAKGARTEDVMRSYEERGSWESRGEICRVRVLQVNRGMENRHRV